MNPLLVASIVCFILAALLIAIEIFVPSAGLLTLAAVVVLIMAVVMLWQVSATAGMASIVIVMVLASVSIWVFFKHFQDMPFTRRLMLLGSQAPVAPADAIKKESLIGRQGIALTDLRPVGTCLFDGERMECMAEAGVIQRDQKVCIVRAGGLEVKVRPVDDASAT